MVDVMDPELGSVAYLQIHAPAALCDKYLFSKKKSRIVEITT
jgi:hypothetical protein